MAVGSSNSGIGIHWFVGNPGNVSTRFIGEIDELRIYDHALSHQEISTLYSSFKPDLFSINAIAHMGGTISPIGNQIVLTGQSESFTIQATGAFHIARIMIDDKSIMDFAVSNLTHHYTFANVTNDHTIEAFFNSPPKIKADVTPIDGVAPLRVSFNLTGATDRENNITRTEIDSNGNGTTDWTANGAATIIGEYPSPGVYTSILQVVDGFGLSDNTSVVITVRGIAPSADLIADVYVGEAALSVSFDATDSIVNYGNTIAVYEWDFTGNGIFDTITTSGTVSYVYGSAGVYSPVVRITDDQGLQDSATVEITVTAPSEPPTVTLSANPDSGTVPLDVTFTATPGYPASAGSYSWDLNGDGHYDLNTTNSTVNRRFTEADSFIVSVVLTDTNCLTASDSVYITTREASRLRVWLNPMPERIWGDKVTIHAQTAPGNVTAGVQIQYKHSATNIWSNIEPYFIPPANSFKTSWNTTGLTSGEDYHLRALAWDTADNVVTSETTTVRLDNTAGRKPGKAIESSVGNVTTKEQTFTAQETAEVIVFDGTGVTLPAGAVVSNPTIIVETAGNTKEPSGAAAGQANANANRKVSIEGNPALSRPITIELPYNDDNDDGLVDGTGIPVSTLMAYWHDTEQNRWRRPLSSEVDTKAKIVRLRNYHLTEFGLFGEENLLHPAVGGYLRNGNQPAYTNYTTAKNISDGNKASFWQSSEDPSEPVIFEYGFTNWQGAIITEAVIKNHEGGYYAKGFSIELSMDGTNYTPVFSGNLPADSEPVTLNLGGVTSRYVRLVITNGYDNNSWALSEFAVKGSLTKDPRGCGMEDWWQIEHFGHYNADPEDDNDNDELTNLEEFLYNGNPTAADSDGDGLPDGWKVHYGFNIGRNAADIDVNSNGFSNLESYIAGICPTNVSSRFELPEPLFDGTWLTNVYYSEGGVWTQIVQYSEGLWETNEITVEPGWYTQTVFHAERMVFSWQTLPGRRYRIYSKTNLLSGEWTPVFECNGEGNQLSFTNDLNTPGTFYRIGVKMNE